MKLAHLFETANINGLAEKLHAFSLNDGDGKDVWNQGRKMYADGWSSSDEDNGDRGMADPAEAATYIVDELYKCILDNRYSGSIVERAGLVAELQALTDDERQSLYDYLYDSVENGLD